MVIRATTHLVKRHTPVQKTDDLSRPANSEVVTRKWTDEEREKYMSLEKPTGKEAKKPMIPNCIKPRKDDEEMAVKAETILKNSPKATKEYYLELKEQGKSDVEIASYFRLKQPTYLYTLKNHWGLNKKAIKFDELTEHFVKSGNIEITARTVTDELEEKDKEIEKLKRELSISWEKCALEQNKINVDGLQAELQESVRLVTEFRGLSEHYAERISDLISSNLEGNRKVKLLEQTLSMYISGAS